MRDYKWYLIIFIIVINFNCSNDHSTKKKVLAIPVYGQSLALGEEATLITDFDAFVENTNHHVLTENLDENFGYLSDTHFKQWMKKLVHDRHRAFELSVYGMSEVLTKYFEEKGQGDSIIISTFPGGQGATGISELGKGSKAYIKFLDEIQTAYNEASDKGWNFIVPAFCWMQGEDDVVWRRSKNYKQELMKFQEDFEKDVKAITRQTESVICVSYQTNCLTSSKEFDASKYNIRETYVPQGQMELIRDNKMFIGSAPTYPYTFVDERVHIDGISQKRLGNMAGLSIIRLFESKSSKGLVPESFTVSGDTILIDFNVPKMPLVFDTLSVVKAENFGFNVVNESDHSIIKKVLLEGNTIKIICSQSPFNAKVRYAVNGVKEKNGYKNGPRGNLRDSQGKDFNVKIQNKNYPLDNWCYQFDVVVK
ncbi:MAG: sialate O-acetylesterase [Bacteroidota bacterium]